MMAQPKPKRDVSKDQKVVQIHVKHLKSKRKLLSLCRRSLKRKNKYHKIKSRKKKYFYQRSKPYLFVNDCSSELTQYLFADASTLIFYVKTNSVNWYIRQLPNWCSVSKNSSYFVLHYQKNPMHESRSASFNVVTDDKKVEINLYQAGNPINFSADIISAYLIHNVLLNGHKYLKINAFVTITGGKGLQCSVGAFIKDKNGYIYDKSSGPNRSILYSDYILKPTSDQPLTYNVSLYILNNNMLLFNKRNKLFCTIYVNCIDSKNMNTYDVPFVAINKKSGVKTKKW
jgi:hypothetical protein